MITDTVPVTRSLTTSARVPSGVIVTSCGSLQPMMVIAKVLVAVSITDTVVLLLVSVT